MVGDKGKIVLYRSRRWANNIINNDSNSNGQAASLEHIPSKLLGTNLPCVMKTHFDSTGALAHASSPPQPIKQSTRHKASCMLTVASISIDELSVSLQKEIRLPAAASIIDRI